MFHFLIDKQGTVRQFVRVRRRALRVAAARYWRLLLANVTFIAVTGSCGKTTATALLAAMLAQKGSVRVGINNNILLSVQQTLLKTRWSNLWCVQEASGMAPGSLAKICAIFRPRVGIVTMIGSDHLSNFRNREAIANEKATLIKCLPRNGTAILNVDDPLVAAMRACTRAHVVTYGRSPEANLRASDIVGAWPDRLRFAVMWRGRSHTVITQLLGTYWVTSILAAMACALEQDVDMDTILRVIRDFEPVFGRNSVHTIPSGPVLLNGAAKAPYATILLDVTVLSEARATRKTLVLGNISDYAGSGSPKYRQVARAAIAGGARVLALGKDASTVSHMIKDYPVGTVLIFDTTQELHEFLLRDHVPGELIMLKSSAVNHLERLVLGWGTSSICWREHCGLRYCSDCPYLHDTTSVLPKNKMRHEEAGP